MKTKIDNILKIWHEYFSNEEKQYTEFESSDIEYFVGCMLYNHFAFSKALDTMKTMDLSYDFLSACGDEYDEIKQMIESIEFDDEMQKLEFLQNFIDESRGKYTQDELYLLDRLKLHIDNLERIYNKEIIPQKVEFVKKTKPANPLLR
jgi:hypothetical protein